MRIRTLVVTLALVCLPLTASAQSIGDLQAQINILLQRLQSLQTPAVISSPVSSRPAWCDSYADLSFGMRGGRVYQLQQAIGYSGLGVAPTGYFGARTQNAWARMCTPIVGNDRDAHGCIPSAGYSWCDSKNKCLRSWEESCPVTPSCRPINYMPIACSDGAQSQPQYDASGCITGYACPVANFVPPNNCSAWNDGCNTCSRSSEGAPAMCTMRACFAAGKGYCTAYFGGTVSVAPSISGFSGPSTLTVNQSGTWSVQASDANNSQLTYSIQWGDEAYTPYASSMMASPVYQQTSFTHTYASAGTYTVRITVTNQSGKSSTATATVVVSGNTGTICTMEYAPVCGQPPEPACRHSFPACMVATPGPTTYSNICMMNAAGASYLYSGTCGYSY